MTEEDIRFNFADVGGVRLHYASAGNAPNLVVLLHGFPEFWYSWRKQIIDLSDEFTVVAPDMRGYGLSSKPSGSSEYTVEKVGNDIAGLIRELGFPSAAVIGHDWGAGVAWSMAAKHSGLVSRVGSLQVPPAEIWKRNISVKQLLASWYMFFFQLPWLPEAILKAGDYKKLKSALQDTTARPGVFTDEHVERYKEMWRQPGALTSMLNYYRANVLSRLRSAPEGHQRIKVPTLFIFAERDTAILPETVADVGSVIDAPYTEHRIPDSGHWVQQEAADEVTAVIRDFLKDQN
jgi:epoxide hydrolase 4